MHHQVHLPRFIEVRQTRINNRHERVSGHVDNHSITIANKSNKHITGSQWEPKTSHWLLFGCYVFTLFYFLVIKG